MFAQKYKIKICGEISDSCTSLQVFYFRMFWLQQSVSWCNFGGDDSLSLIKAVVFLAR